MPTRFRLSAVGSWTMVSSLAVVTALSTTACATSETDEAEGTDGAAVAEATDGWRTLFDGASLAGWRSYYAEDPPDGWRAEDGTLHRFGPGGDIMTVDEFEDFELRLEWKVAEAGNSGIFYLAQTGSDNIFQSAPEMQVLDDAGHPDGGDPLSSAGANFGLYATRPGVVRPAGEWNAVRIVKRGDQIEHWLNDEKVVEYELGSDDWNARVAASKFAEWPEYGTARRGHIGLQDHGDPVWYRNIRIREFDGSDAEGDAEPGA